VCCSRRLRPQAEALRIGGGPRIRFCHSRGVWSIFLSSSAYLWRRKSGASLQVRRIACSGETMSWYVTAGGEPMGPLPERQVISMLRSGVRLQAVARDVDKHWWDPMRYPPFAEAISQGEAQALALSLGQPQVETTQSRRGSAKTAAVIAVGLSLFAGLAWWSGLSGRDPMAHLAETSTAESHDEAEVHDVAEVALGSTSRSSDCDVEKLWFRGEGLTPAERRANVILAVENWSTDCRWRAMDGICQNGCDGLLSEALLNASPKAERAALTRLRAERNRGVATRSRAIYADVMQLSRDVVPSGASAGSNGGTGAQGSPGASRGARKSADDAPAMGETATCAASGTDAIGGNGGTASRIDALRQKLDGPPSVAVGAFWMKEALRAIESCADCGGDRTHCTEVARFLKSADDDIRGYEKKGELDRKTVAVARGR
jgi:hypothetical protein